jgi:aldose 1-epimerase
VVGPSVAREPFGSLPDGTAIDRYTLSNGGLEVRVLTYGAIVQELRDPTGTNVALGFATLDDYVERNSPYFGAIIGRYANRIGGAAFTLDGVTCRIPANEGPNSLHGGTAGFDKRVWRVGAAGPVADGARLELLYTSPDGEMGYPGTLDVRLTYTLAGVGSLRIDYQASTDRPTVVNLTNHTYWNLAGEGSGSIADHVLTLAASRYTPLGPGWIPTGEIAPVAGTPLDFREPVAIGARIDEAFPQLALTGGYDHNYVLDRDDDTSLVRAALVREPASGRELEVLTTEPGLQLYSGNLLDGTPAGTSGRRYVRRSGLALETQHFPDSPNQRGFPSTVLRPAEVYRSATVYRLGNS